MPTHYERDASEISKSTTYAAVPIRYRPGVDSQKLIKLVIPGVEPPLLFVRVEGDEGSITAEVVNPDQINEEVDKQEVSIKEGVEDEDGKSESDNDQDSSHQEQEVVPSDVVEDAIAEDKEREEGLDDLNDTSTDEEEDLVDFYKVTDEEGKEEIIEITGTDEERANTLAEVKKEFISVTLMTKAEAESQSED